MSSSLGFTGKGFDLDVEGKRATFQFLEGSLLSGNTIINNIQNDATHLVTTGASVNVSASAPPTGANQLLATTGATTATWQAATTVTGPRTFECVVDAAGSGDFTTINAALTAGCSRIYVRAGTYSEATDIVIPNFGALVGETAGSVVINLTAGATLTADGSGGVTETGGTVSITTDTSAVTGAGTTFTNLSSGDFIRLGAAFYEIDTITDNTNLTITEVYRGQTLAGESYLAQSMFSGVYISNLIIAGSSSTGLLARALRHSTLETILVRDSTPNISVIACTVIRVIGLVSESSIGVGITFDDCFTIGVSTMNIYNSSGDGVNVLGTSQSIALDAILVANSGSDGIDIQDSSTLIKITDCVICFSDSKGINTDGSTGTVIIDGCTVHENGTQGVDFDGTNNIVSNSVIINNGDAGMFAGDGGVIQGNQIEGNGDMGISLDGDTDCTIIGNIIANNTGDGIGGTTGAGNVISGNRVSGNTADGIDIASGGVNCGIYNNICTGNGDAGIEIDAVDCIITGNRCTGNTGEGIHIQAGGDEAIVTSNNVKANTGTNLLIDGGAAGVITANNKT